MNEKILDILDEIYNQQNENNLDCSSLKSYEKQIFSFLKEDNINADFFDLLLMKRYNNTSLLFDIVYKNNSKLFSEILDKYKDRIESCKENLELMLWVDENNCHKVLYDHCGKDFFDNLNHLNCHVLYYTNKNFVKYYSLGKLDGFFKLENIIKIDEYIEDVFSHVLIFFAEDKKGFENILYNPPKKDNVEFNVNNLIYNEINSQNPFAAKTLHVSNENEINTLVSIWGFDKTSEIISEYMNLQKRYMKTKFPLLSNIEFDSGKMRNIIKAGINLNDCGSALAFGLRNNPDFLSHFIITGVISPEDLLVNIMDKDIQAKTHYDVLKNNLNENTENRLNKRVKL